MSDGAGGQADRSGASTVMVSVYPTLLHSRLQERDIAARRGHDHGPVWHRLQWQVPLLEALIEWETWYRDGATDPDVAERILNTVSPLTHANHAPDIVNGLLWGQAYLPPMGPLRNPLQLARHDANRARHADRG